jgi:hypothetical protein
VDETGSIINVLGFHPVDGAEQSEPDSCGRSHRHDSTDGGLLQKRFSPDTKTVWLAGIGYEVLEHHAA